MGGLILVVGERMNLPSLTRELTPKRWSRMAVRVGAFHDPRSRKKLLSAGLDLDGADIMAMNLTPPAVQGVRWDKEFAERVASLTDLSGYAATFLCGRRVASAFGVAYDVGSLAFPEEVLERYVMTLPHPSGLCRFWNSAADVAGLKTKVSDLLEMTCRRSART